MRKFFQSILISILFFSLAGVANAQITIQPFDFTGYKGVIKKNWDTTTANHVIKKFLATTPYKNNKNYAISSLKAGATNNFIYLINIDGKTTFVLKGIGNAREAQKLAELQYNNKINELNKSRGTAKIINSKLISSYKVNDTIHYFSIMDAAQGKDMFSLMSKYLINASNAQNLQTLDRIFYTTGKQLSEMHKAYVGVDNFITPKGLRSIEHDDMHPENTFFDEQNKQFYLIDNESIADSLIAPRSVNDELIGFYMIPILRWPSERIHTDILADVPAENIAQIYASFIHGLAEPYADSAQALQVFKNIIITSNNNAIRYLKQPWGESWMYNPAGNKAYQHIVHGKFHNVAGSSKAHKYIDQLEKINISLQYI